MTHASLAGASVCDLCLAGSYGSVSGEQMRTSVDRDHEAEFSLHCSEKFSMYALSHILFNAGLSLLVFSSRV
jgi:hypothetical protein